MTSIGEGVASAATISFSEGRGLMSDIVVLILSVLGNEIGEGLSEK